MMMAAQVLLVRPLIVIQSYSRAALNQLLFRRHFPSSLHLNTRRVYETGVSESVRGFQIRTRAGLAAYERTSYSSDEDEFDSNKKSRNEKKREARRAVKWGTDLASFSIPQIKRIVKVASLDPEVFEAIMLVKRLGRDVREGKRRQFNYIGRLLREAEPELMDGLIQATKDSDPNKFQAVCSSAKIFISEDDDGDDDNDDVLEDIGSSDEDEDSNEITEKTNRWFDGLINKDVEISKEIYTLQDVDFDRQELRRLVRQLYSARERQIDLEENQEVNKAIISAERSLSGFVRNLVKQIQPE